MRLIGFATFHDATTVTASSPNKAEKIDQKTVAVSRRCQDFLRGNKGLWPTANFASVYRTAAFERGFVGNGRLRSDKLKEAINAFYGKTVLYQQIDFGRQFPWLRNLLVPDELVDSDPDLNGDRKLWQQHTRRGIPVTHPGHHALLQYFLESF